MGLRSFHNLIGKGTEITLGGGLLISEESFTENENTKSTSEGISNVCDGLKPDFRFVSSSLLG